MQLLTYMQIITSSNQYSQAAALCTQVEQYIGVGHVHRRLSKTMSTFTGWLCARLNTDVIINRCPGLGCLLVVLTLVLKILLEALSILWHRWGFQCERWFVVGSLLTTADKSRHN